MWIFDPGFCDGTTSAGTGENWTVGGSNGYGSRQPVSAFFDLWDTKETLLDQGDDTLVGSTNSDFRRLLYEDHTIFDEKGLSTHVADCSSQSWHLGWYQIATGLPEGTYRLHTYSTDTGSLGDQDDTTALNSFAFYASSASGTPRIHGLGAMEAYVRLPAGQVSEFYLAQIKKVHAGKTMVINLWDPGDPATSRRRSRSSHQPGRASLPPSSTTRARRATRTRNLRLRLAPRAPTSTR